MKIWVQMPMERIRFSMGRRTFHFPAAPFPIDDSPKDTRNLPKYKARVQNISVPRVRYQPFDKENTRFLHSCIENGNFEGVRRMESSKSADWDRAFVWAAQYNRLNILRWLFQHHRRPRDLSERSACFGHLDIIKCLHTKLSDKDWTTRAMDNAARHGHLDIVLWLHEHRSEGCTEVAMEGAAGKGHLAVVCWLFENRSEMCTIDGILEAIMNGHMQVAQWLYQHQSIWRGKDTGFFEDYPLMDAAAESGQLEVLIWLHNHGCNECTNTAMNAAAWQGHLDVVKWLHANRKEGCTRDAIDRAAQNGHLDVIKWLHHNRSEGCSDVAISFAKAEGHDHIASWIRDNVANRVVGDSLYIY